MERGCRRYSQGTCVAQQRRARELSIAVAAVDIRIDVRGDEVAYANAGRRIGPILQLAGSAKGAQQWICKRTLYATELAVGKNTSNPRTAELPIVTDAHRAEIPIATVFMSDRQWRAAGKARFEIVRVEHAMAATAEDVEAGPVIDGRHRRTLGEATGCQACRR